MQFNDVNQSSFNAELSRDSAKLDSDAARFKSNKKEKKVVDANYEGNETRTAIKDKNNVKAEAHVDTLQLGDAPVVRIG